MYQNSSTLVLTLCTVLIFAYGVTCDGDIKENNHVEKFTNQNLISNSNSQPSPSNTIKSIPVASFTFPGEEEKKGEEVKPRACPYCTGTECTGVSGYIFEPVIIVKVIVALIFGALFFFALLFFYKLWAFVDLPYETSVYYGSGSSASYSKPYGQARASQHPIVSLTKSILDALEKVY